MKTSMLSALAGAAFLASGAMAGAGEPVKLGSAELDTVTAGAFDPLAIAAITQSFSQSNEANVYVSQRARATSVFDDATAINYSSVTIGQANVADDTTLSNTGNATATASND